MSTRTSATEPSTIQAARRQECDSQGPIATVTATAPARRAELGKPAFVTSASCARLVASRRDGEPEQALERGHHQAGDDGTPGQRREETETSTPQQGRDDRDDRGDGDDLHQAGQQLPGDGVGLQSPDRRGARAEQALGHHRGDHHRRHQDHAADDQTDHVAGMPVARRTGWRARSRESPPSEVRAAIGDELGPPSPAAVRSSTSVKPSSTAGTLTLARWQRALNRGAAPSVSFA